MKNEIYKIFILHPSVRGCKKIKEVLVEEYPHLLFVTAQTEKCFLRKLKWMEPDLILASSSAVSFIDSGIYSMPEIPPVVLMVDHLATIKDPIQQLKCPHHSVSTRSLSQFKKVVFSILTRNKTLMEGEKRFGDWYVWIR